LLLESKKPKEPVLKIQQNKGREERNPTTEMSETALVPYLQPVTNNGQCNGSRRQLQLACSKELHHKNPTQHQNRQPLQQRGETEHGAGRLLQAHVNTMIDNRRRCVNYYYWQKAATEEDPTTQNGRGSPPWTIDLTTQHTNQIFFV
jgi:hypothetical protein